MPLYKLTYLHRSREVVNGVLYIGPEVVVNKQLL